MGDIADAIIDGELCQSCGQYIGEGCGYPRDCMECGGDDFIDLDFDMEKDFPDRTPGAKLSKAEQKAMNIEKAARQKKTKCPVCQRKVKEVGLNDHMRALHTEKKPI